MLIIHSEDAVLRNTRNIVAWHQSWRSYTGEADVYTAGTSAMHKPSKNILNRDHWPWKLVSDNYLISSTSDKSSENPKPLMPPQRRHVASGRPNPYPLPIVYQGQSGIEVPWRFRINLTQARNMQIKGSRESLRAYTQKCQKYNRNTTRQLLCYKTATICYGPTQWTRPTWRGRTSVLLNISR